VDENGYDFEAFEWPWRKTDSLKKSWGLKLKLDSI
jgi:hypothetical protein